MVNKSYGEISNQSGDYICHRAVRETWEEHLADLKTALKGGEEQITTKYEIQVISEVIKLIKEFLGLAKVK